MTVADLQKAEVASRQRPCGLRDLGKSFRCKDAAADCPKQAGTGPCHALKKAAAINPVVFVVVRNVIGHNIWCVKLLIEIAYTYPYRFGAPLFPKSFRSRRSQRR